MKTTKRILFITVSLALLLFTFDSCKKDVIDQPSPLGPSTVAVFLVLDANPNVIMAGLQNRQTTEITASLKKYDGTPISDKTVYFEVVDENGNRMNLGYFDGNLSMQSVLTDSGGTARTHYYGPLKDEVTAEGYLYIRATVAWEGSQFISDITPLYVVRGEITLSAQAIPDVLYAGTTRSRSEIRAFVTVGGAPKAGVPVYFYLNNDFGRFEGGKKNTKVLTNSNGVASIDYLGPLAAEMAVDGVMVSITVQVTQSVFEDLLIQIVRQK
jgi:hypothetical protein